MTRMMDPFARFFFFRNSLQALLYTYLYVGRSIALPLDIFTREKTVSTRTTLAVFLVIVLCSATASPL